MAERREINQKDIHRQDIHQGDTRQRNIDRSNDAKLFRPLLLMALIVVGILLYYAYTGQLHA